MSVLYSSDALDEIYGWLCPVDHIAIAIIAKECERVRTPDCQAAFVFLCGSDFAFLFPVPCSLDSLNDLAW